MKSFKLIVIWSIAGLLFFIMVMLAVLEPVTWYYRDSFKCIECGKDWKD